MLMHKHNHTIGWRQLGHWGVWVLVYVGQAYLSTGAAAGGVDKSPPNSVFPLFLPKLLLPLFISPTHTHTHTHTHTRLYMCAYSIKCTNIHTRLMAAHYAMPAHGKQQLSLSPYPFPLCTK